MSRTLSRASAVADGESSTTISTPGPVTPTLPTTGSSALMRVSREWAASSSPKAAARSVAISWVREVTLPAAGPARVPRSVHD